MKTLIARDERGEARWLGALYPTEAAAQEAGMSLDDYRAFLARALRLDRQDPVAAWRRAAERQRRIQERLAAVRELRLRGPGTDLLVGVAGRRWISSAGRHNLPDGEVFTGPEEEVTEGTVAFAFPALWGGRSTSGIRLRFAGGRCVDASAESGEEFLLAALDSDAGARTLGEFAFGLNEGVDRPTGSTLLDEKMGGTVHMALGNAYPATGGRNVSDLHWDLVCDLRAGGEVHADGELAYRDGAFLPGFLGAT
jgi:aminopeptidase